MEGIMNSSLNRLKYISLNIGACVKIPFRIMSCACLTQGGERHISHLCESREVL